jgi:hypothetical protein
LNDNEEKAVTEAFRQLSAKGRREALAYALTLTKAETAMKGQYGPSLENGPVQPAQSITP